MAAKAKVDDLKSVADYNEALSILTEMARGGDVRAAIALAGHLRKSDSPSRGAAPSAIDRIAARRGGEPDPFDEFDQLAGRRKAA